MWARKISERWSGPGPKEIVRRYNTEGDENKSKGKTSGGRKVDKPQEENLSAFLEWMTG